MTTRKIKRNIFSFITIASMIVSLLAIFSSAFVAQDAKADSNVATWLLCGTEDGKMVYNAATTDLVPYSIRSKSSVTSTDRIDGFLNSVLSTAGFKFEEVNEKILGRPIEITEDKEDDDVDTDETPAGADANESAPRVNPFDRFGVAGIKWSSYSGEWKYYQTDGCADNEEASKTNFGEFYEGRKEPKASFNETTSSNDPRVIQYNKGVLRSWMNAFNGLLTNGLLTITKIVVTFTITLIGYSFTDVTELIGLGSSNSTGGLIGLFNNLYNGFFLSLMGVAFVGTTVYVIYYGLIKRQIRQALINGLFQSILCLLAAFIIAGNASFWIPLPNRIATYGQAIIISAMGQSSDSTNGLCGTNVGAMKAGKDLINLNADDKTLNKELANVGNNMKSTMGCRMWEEFLLKPWARGQFGSEYKDLVVAGAPSAKLKNKNSEWTMLADVPLGGGVVEHNLALFQLSTQTNVHAQLSGETGVATDSTLNHPQLVDGVSTDWWRVSDILSNYNEKEVKTTPVGGKDQVASIVQTDDLPLDEWQYWIGNKQHERYSTALLSIIFGVLGSVGPLVFGFMSVVYSVGVTLLMAISPVFFLMGVWAGKGQAIFRGWLEALVSTMIKKVVASGMLLISFAFTISAMNMIDSIGWLKSFLLLALVTYIIIKNRKMIMDMFSRVNFGGITSPDKMFSQYLSNKNKHTKDAALIAGAAVQGASTAKDVGLSWKEGAAMGAGVQMENTLRKSMFGRNVLLQSRVNSNTTMIACQQCGDKITGTGFMDEDGVEYCSNCARDMGAETELQSFKVNRDGLSGPMKRIRKDEEGSRGAARKDKAVNNPYFSTEGYMKEMKTIRRNRQLTRGVTEEELLEKGAQVFNYQNGTDNKTWISFTRAAETIGIEKDDAGNVYWDNDSALNMIDRNLASLDTAFEQYESAWQEIGDNANPPVIPEPIARYLSTAVHDEAWHAGRYTSVKEMYREGWSEWYIDSSMSINTLNPDEIAESIDIISEMGRHDRALPSSGEDLLSSSKESRSNDRPNSDGDLLSSHEDFASESEGGDYNDVRTSTSSDELVERRTMPYIAGRSSVVDSDKEESPSSKDISKSSIRTHSGDSISVDSRTEASDSEGRYYEEKSATSMRTPSGDSIVISRDIDDESLHEDNPMKKSSSLESGSARTSSQGGKASITPSSSIRTTDGIVDLDSNGINQSFDSSSSDARRSERLMSEQVDFDDLTYTRERPRFKTKVRKDIQKRNEISPTIEIEDIEIDELEKEEFIPNAKTMETLHKNEAPIEEEEIEEEVILPQVHLNNTKNEDNEE